jgi:perosamine synthetase
MIIPLSRPDITEAECDAVLDVLRSDALSLGPRLPAFEQAVAEAAATPYAVAVNSGTSALHLAVKSAGIAEGHEVITTPFSFVASANAILFERATPVFADIDPDTYNIDPGKVRDAVTSRTRGLLPVHVFGRPADLPALLDIADAHRLAVIEDACEAVGATIGGRPVGGWGHAGVFAFYPNKQLTTGEGGAVVTTSEEVAARCRSWRNQGRGEAGSWLQHERLGYNYRLSDLNCALGSVQFARRREILAMRERVARAYTERLKFMVPEVIPPAPPAHGAEISWFVYVVRLRDEYSRADRDAVLARLKEQGIGCNNYFTPIHLQPFYRERFGFARGDFPITERVAERTIALPFHNRLSTQEIDLVAGALREAVDTVCRKHAFALRVAI